jgi:hypothetical protein
MDRWRGISVLRFQKKCGEFAAGCIVVARGHRARIAQGYKGKHGNKRLRVRGTRATGTNGLRNLLLVAEGDDGIHFGGAMGGDVAGGEGDEDESCRDSGEG